MSINPNPSGDDVEEDDTPHFSQLRVELYPELVLKFAKVEIEAKRSSSARIGVSVDHCTSCGKRGARRCTQCNDVSYCGRTCQEAHWKYHKQSCKSKKGRAEGNSTNVIDVPMSRNGKVGLSNLGNTCFMNSGKCMRVIHKQQKMSYSIDCSSFGSTHSSSMFESHRNFDQAFCQR